MQSHELLAGLIIFAAHCCSAVTGFGASILGLPLLSLVVGLMPGKQALVVQGFMLNLYMSTRWRQRIDRRQLAIMVLVAGVGLIVGMLIFELLPDRGSQIVLAVFVIAVGARGLFNLAPSFRAPGWLARVMLFLGGVVHGAFATGGPLLVVYCRRVLPHKSVFRATLSAMWLALSVGLQIGWTLSHTWDARTPRVILIGLPFLLLGIIVGEYLHHRVDERRFAALVNLTLVVVGSILLWQSLLKA